MVDYESEREYEKRLRKIVLLSADVLPERVASYLEGLASERTWRDVEQPLTEYASLVRNMPRQFVDYAMKALIENEEELDWSDRSPDQLGIRRIHEFFPAAPIQGPFLELLRQNEDEGLRLLHGLTNRATQVWKSFMQTEGILGTPLTPIPLVLALPLGLKTFWGDEHLYRWHRGTSTGPLAVVSALMALEMWLEEQLDSGRSADELFAKALAGSESVAVLGVCASVSLYAPGKCLAAASPLLSHPRIWRLDLARLLHETSSIPPFSIPRTEVFDKLLADRSRRPYRRADIRVLVPHYLFGNEELRAKFHNSTAQFRDSPAFEFKEEQAAPDQRAKVEEELEHFVHFLDSSRYQQVREGGAIFLRYVPPEHLAEGAGKALTFEAELAAWLHLAEWARNSIDAGSVASGMTVAEAIEYGRSFGSDGDFDLPVTPDLGPQCFRLEAIAQAASAALVVASATLDAESVAWCRDTLVRAAMSPRGGWVIEETHHPSDIKVSAARGLGALIGRGRSEESARAAIFLLLLDPEYQVTEAVFSGLTDAWEADPVLCWNAFSFVLTQSALPRRGVVFGMGRKLNEFGEKWLETAITTYTRNIEQGIVPDLPDFLGTDEAFFVHSIVARALKHLPTDLLLATDPSRSRLVGLIDKLLDKTFEEIERTSDDHSQYLTLEFQWIGFLMEWLAKTGLALSSEDEALHVLDRIEVTWPELPSLTKGMLRGFLNFRIGTLDLPSANSLAAWQRICSWVLGSPEVKALAEDVSYPSDFDDPLALIVFVEFGKYWFKPIWTHAPLFEALFDRWISTVGTNHAAYSALLTLLMGTGDRFETERVLGWLKGIAERSENVRDLWMAHRNGERTTELLGSITRRNADAVRQPVLLQPLIWLVDRLATCGIAHASRLRQELERPAT